MMFYTHLAFALLSSLVALRFLSVSNVYLFIIIACFTALVPDIDNRSSKLGSRFKIVSWVFDHRGILHTIFPPVLLFLLFNYLGYNIIALAILVGYSSHILIDALTIEGINFLHPFSSFRISGFVRTGKLMEIILFLFFIGMDIFFVINLIL